MKPEETDHLLQWYEKAEELIPLLDALMPANEQGGYESAVFAGEHAYVIEEYLEFSVRLGIVIPPEVAARLHQLEELIPPSPDSPMAKYQAAPAH